MFKLTSLEAFPCSLPMHCWKPTFDITRSSNTTVAKNRRRQHRIIENLDIITEKITKCNCLDSEIIQSWPIMLQNLPGHWHNDHNHFTRGQHLPNGLEAALCADSIETPKIFKWEMKRSQHVTSWTWKH